MVTLGDYARVLEIEQPKTPFACPEEPILSMLFPNLKMIELNVLVIKICLPCNTWSDFII